MNNILARAFYALNDIKTPMKISLVCLALNLVFALWLVRPYREAGLAVANTLSAGFNTALLLFALRKKLARLDMAGLPQTVFTLLGGGGTGGRAGVWALPLLGGEARPRDLAGETRRGVRAGRAGGGGLLAARVVGEGSRRGEMSGLIRQKLRSRLSDSKVKNSSAPARRAVILPFAFGVCLNLFRSGTNIVRLGLQQKN